MVARVSSGSSKICSEDSDSTAVSLIYNSDGVNPKSLGESGPRP